MVNFTSVANTTRRAAEVAKNADAARAALNDWKNADKEQLGRDAGRAAINHGTGLGMAAGKTWLKSIEAMPRIFVRFAQFTMALVAVGFYGHRVDADRKAKEGFAPEWLFAVVICGLSALSSVIFLLGASAGPIPCLGRLGITKTYRAWPWDATLCLAWVVMFGMFTGIFLNRKKDDPYKGANVSAMKVAAWVDLVNMVLWMLTAIYGCLKNFAGQKMEQLGNKISNMICGKRNKKDKVEMGNYSANV